MNSSFVNNLPPNDAWVTHAPVATYLRDDSGSILKFAIDFKERGESAFRAFELLRDDGFEVAHPRKDTNGWHVSITLNLFDDQELAAKIDRLDKIASRFQCQYSNTAQEELSLHSQLLEQEKESTRIAFSEGLFELCEAKLQHLLAHHRIEPSEALGMLGVTKFELGKFAEAKALFQQHLAFRLEPQPRGVSRRYLAECCAMEGDYEKAEEHWIEALATPSIHFAHYGLARCRCRSGQIKQAMFWLRSACHAIPDLIEKARTEPDFAKVAESAEFLRIAYPNRWNRFFRALTKLFQRKRKTS